MAHHEFEMPVTAEQVRALRVNDTVTLEGTLYAKSIIVEKGGIFSGELFIGQKGPDSETVEQQSLFGDDALQLKPA